MKILIIGSGAIGGLIGARLVERKADVTFLVRPERKVQLLTRGLILTSHYGRFRRPVHAITFAELTGRFDLIEVTERAQDYEIVLKQIILAIGSETAVLSLLEGAAHLEPALVPHGGRLIGGMIEARVIVDADGVLHQHLVLCRIMPEACLRHDRQPPRLDMAIYPYLPKATVAMTSARDYMGLLAGAGS